MNNEWLTLGGSISFPLIVLLTLHPNCWATDNPTAVRGFFLSFGAQGTESSHPLQQMLLQYEKLLPNSGLRVLLFLYQPPVLRDWMKMAPFQSCVQ